jgi:serine/threonine-protein kinase PknK
LIKSVAETRTRAAASATLELADGKWSTGPPMPTARHAEVVATVGNTVYAIGGANRPTHEGPIATVEALDFK